MMINKRAMSDNDDGRGWSVMKTTKMDNDGAERWMMDDNGDKEDDRKTDDGDGRK